VLPRLIIVRQGIRLVKRPISISVVINGEVRATRVRRVAVENRAISYARISINKILYRCKSGSLMTIELLVWIKRRLE